MRRLVLLSALIWATGAAAEPVPIIVNGFQIIVNFDNVDIGTTEFVTASFIANRIDGGGIVASTIEHPAVSGDRLMGGTSIGFTVGPARQDLVDYSWPGVGAFVTGTAPIVLTLSAYDYDLDSEVVVGSIVAAAGVVNFRLSTEDGFGGGFFTSARFTSDAYFTLDDLAIGLPDVGPGIPEPATWALLIGGFGLTGSAMRRRRGAVA